MYETERKQESQCTYIVTLRRVLATIVTLEKQYSECVYVAFGIQHMQYTCTVLLSVACPALQHFCTLSYKRYDFRKKKKLLDIKCLFRFSLQLLSGTFFILRVERDVNKNVFGLHVKYTLFLSDFNEICFFDNFSKITHINFRENPSSGRRVVPCGRTDGQT